MIPFSDRLVANCNYNSGYQPFITIAIPHYKQRLYLEIVLYSLFEQKFDNFEIVISDDCSPDDSVATLPDLLKRSGRSFRYYLQPTNLGYDGNVRFCLRVAQGHYVFLLGNDDALNLPTTLQELHDKLHQLGLPAVAHTNYADWTTGTVIQRTNTTRLLGSGPTTAVRFFLNFSFVSGIIFERTAAQQHETDRWDQSIFYQIYLASRIIAAGGQMAALDTCAVRKDVKIRWEGVRNYTHIIADEGWTFRPRDGHVPAIIRITVDAVIPFLPDSLHSKTIRYIVSKMLLNYLYWLLEYRRVGNWSIGFGLARGVWAGTLLAEYDKLKWSDRVFLWALYLGLTIFGLFAPQSFYIYLKDSEWFRKIWRFGQRVLVKNYS